MARQRTVVKEKEGKNEASVKLSLDELVKKLIGECLEALDKKELEVTLADLFRMRELQKELAPKEPERRQVTWVDSWD